MGAADWQAFVYEASDVTVNGASLEVALGDGRRQRVTVREASSTFELSSVVVRADRLSEIEDAALRAWRRNRTTHLVGFKIDQRGRLVATAWVAKAGVSGDEFVSHVRRLAREADLFESQLTGVDRE